MKNNIKITIPEPCHENWLEITPTEKGRFCSNCQKNVIDFTKASDKEILIAYTKNNILCGCFNNTQLNRNIMTPKEKNSFWMIAAATMIVFLGLGNQAAIAQGKVQTDKKQQGDSINIKSTKNKYSGIVLDESDNPLPGAFVMIKESKVGIYTDGEGKFSIDAQKGHKLKILFIGYKDLEFKLKKKSKIIIKLEKIPTPGVLIITKYDNE
jgi:hypothetical protein